MRIDPEAIAEFPLRMLCESCPNTLVPIAARLEEGFNQPCVADVDFVSDTARIDLDTLMGQKVELIFKVPDAPDRLEAGLRERRHVGICTNVRFVGAPDGTCHYRAEIRSRLALLSLNRDCRIYQEMTAPEIIAEVLRDYAVMFDEAYTEDFPTRTITVQYRESDLDFLHRLMEEEGIHYFFEHDGSEETLKLHDDSAAHDPVECEATIEYLELEEADRRNLEHLSEWYPIHEATTGRYTLNDYDFTNPRALLESSRNLPKGSHGLNEREFYDYPGHFRTGTEGERYARIRMEERALHHRTWQAAGLASNLEVGRSFSVKGHPSTDEADEFVTSWTSHVYQLNEEHLAGIEIGRLPGDSLLEEIRGPDPYRVRLRAIPKKEKFRPEAVTPWPEIAGCHTAVVVGPSGEEIHTDQYGRIRIQFHWDRLGNSDDKSTCWVRCMMPWTGKNWGMIAIPRIGQEVVVQFEEGDPDRPLVIGMLYNADTMPPYELPANKTQSGIKTRSSKEGSSSNFNELRFEDKKGSEEVYLHAEKNYTQVVENDASIEIGFEDQSKGDLTQKVYHDKIEEIGNDYTLKIGSGDGGKSPGDLVHEVFNDRTEKIGNHFTTTVEKGNHKTTVSQGNQENTVKMGNQKNTVKMGNFTEEISMGNHTTKVNLGKTTHTAMQSIEFKVGANSIKIDQMGVTIKGIMVKIEGTAMLDAKAPMTTVKGDGILILKGGIMMIN